MALAKNKDMTLSPSFLMMINSYYNQSSDKKIKNLIIADLSQFVSTDKSSKGHLFYNFKKNYESENFDDIELGLKLEQVTAIHT